MGLGGVISNPFFSSRKSQIRPYGSPVFVSTWRWGERAVREAAKVLDRSGSLLDAVEAGVRTAEDDPEVMSVGYGGLPNAEGVVELDAAIMDGKSMRAGAVASLRNIRNPISVARKVMEHTTHIMLVGEGALKFAKEYGFKEEDLLTDAARERWLRWRERLGPHNSYQLKEEDHDTIGLVGQFAGPGNNPGNFFWVFSSTSFPEPSHRPSGDDNPVSYTPPPGSFRRYESPLLPHRWHRLRPPRYRSRTRLR